MRPNARNIWQGFGVMLLLNELHVQKTLIMLIKICKHQRNNVYFQIYIVITCSCCYQLNGTSGDFLRFFLCVCIYLSGLTTRIEVYEVQKITGDTLDNVCE